MAQYGRCKVTMFLRAERPHHRELALICPRMEWFFLESEMVHSIVGRANFPISLLSG